jgi:phage-related protein
VPAAAAVVTTLELVAPAAGVAVTGLAALALAQGTVKLATVGMGDALKAALDPAAADDFTKTLERLSPEARKFAQSVHEAAPALQRMQQSVQDRVFKGLGDQLERTGKSVLPVLRTNLLSTAGTLNEMGRNTLMAAGYLGESGTLGKALGSASAGLRNLAGVPPVVVNALGQIAAAAGPTFERLTAAAGRGAAGLGDKLAGAFESGAMQKAIEQAMSVLRQLGSVAGNVGTILGNLFGAMPPGGGGLVAVLEDVSSAIANITGTKEVQQGLAALFQTMSTLSGAAAPLLAQALGAIAPVFTALGPPLQTVISALQVGLTPIIEQLGPVLAQAAVAVGQLVTAFAPMLPVMGQLIASLLPALSPLLDAISRIFIQLAPVVQTLATTLAAALAPILAQLPVLIGPLADMIANSLVMGLTILQQLFVALAPSLISLGQSFGTLMVALAPVLQAVAQLQAELLTQLMPVITPLIGLLGQLAAFLAGTLAAYINNIVVPALRFVTKLLSGDFSGAWSMATSAVTKAGSMINQAAVALASRVGSAIGQAVMWLASMPGRATSALAGLVGSLAGAAASAGSRLVSGLAGKVGEALAYLRSIPGRAASALGGLGGVLYGAGASLISGFISGITSKIGAIKSTLAGITSMIPKHKGPPEKDAKLLTPSGRLLIEGFIKGITGSTAKLRSVLASITKALPDNVKSGIGKSLARATAELQRQVTARDAVLKKLAASQKQLDGLVKARSKVASDISSGILKEADITTGHGDVNSVSAITVELQQALKSSQAFQANIEALKKAGLRSDLLQEIADKGVSGGGATAAALAKATPAELKRINDLQGALAKSASATGATVGDALYGAGIRAAQGLVAGLKSQEAAIEAQMRKIAEGMLATVKKAHKTHSPSRAFADIGRMDMEGWRGGVLAHSRKVLAAARDTARGVLRAASGVGGALATVPTSSQLAGAYGVVGGRGDQNTVINLYQTEATPDGMLRALSWQGLVGGR